MTRREYIHVGSTAASMRLSVKNNWDPFIQVQ
jgi:hypothetical protein